MEKGGGKMKDEKMCAYGHNHGISGKHVYILLGVLAFFYGLMNNFIVVHEWAGYAAWMVGGVLLVLVGWFKKWMHMRTCMGESQKIRFLLHFICFSLGGGYFLIFSQGKALLPKLPYAAVFA